MARAVLAAAVLLLAGAASPTGPRSARASAAEGAAPSYTLVDLGAATQYPASEALTINNRGDIIGDSLPVVGPGQTKIEWHVDPSTHDVTEGTPPQDVLPRGLADDGSALVTFDVAGVPRAAISNAAGAVHFIGPLAADGSGNFGAGSDLNASGLNNHGLAIGSTNGVGAWLWDDAAATATPFAAPPCACRFGFGPAAINDAGEVAGTARTSSGQDLGLITSSPAGPYSSLGSLNGGGSVRVSGINSQGDVVGTATTSCTVATYQCSPPGVIGHAYVSSSGQMTDLGTLPLPEPPGATTVRPTRSTTPATSWATPTDRRDRTSATATPSRGTTARSTT